jgi:Mlc titration factor MtfA (ptsG expression regulator)
MILVLQVLFVLAALIVFILFVLRPKKKRAGYPMPEEYRQILSDYVKFYQQLDDTGKVKFEERFERFLSSVKITGANAEVEDMDRVLIGAAAIIPVYYIPDWEYINLREVLLYPGNFNHDFDQYGEDRAISGMVGTGALQHVMIISKWELRQGFISSSDRNTAIHEFVHLIDKMDGTTDGVPELLLERRYVPQWQNLVHEEMMKIRRGESDIDIYGATSPVEFFAVASEYFFEQPELFRQNHPELNEMMERIFLKK